MTVKECDAVLHDLRNAMEHIQAARQKARESDVGAWCRAVVGQRITDAGRKLLDAERMMFLVRESMEKLARGEELGPMDGIDLSIGGKA